MSWEHTQLEERWKRCDAHGCSGRAYWSNFCGAYVCDCCGKHRSLARCYCGWAQDGGDGRRQLEDMGEVIGDV